MADVAVHGVAPLLAELIERLRAEGHTVSARPTGVSPGEAHELDAVVVHVRGPLPAGPDGPDGPSEVEALVAAGGRARVVVLLEEPREEDLLRLPTVAALAVRQGALRLDEMLTVVKKALAREPLGLGPYLAASAPTRQITLHQSLQRGEALDQIDNVVRELSPDARRLSQILTIADELLTNAFYHAPVDGIGGHPFSHVSRMDPVQARPGREIELSFAHDSERVGIAVRDRYGSLEEAKVRAHLARAVTNPDASFRVSTGPGGAKIGLITAVRAASQLVFNLVPGQLTEGIGIVDIKGTYRQFLEAGRAVQLYSWPAGLPR